MLFDPIAVTLALFVGLALLVPAPAQWRRHPPPAQGPGARGAARSL
jgi:hypothetical protein